MSDAYERAKVGRLTFKGGVLATRAKDIDKKKKKKNKNKNQASLGDDSDTPKDEPSQAPPAESSEIYTIDAAKKMKYDELFPVEAKKFRYDPIAEAKTVEQALNDRVKKKADRYCK